MRNKAKDGKGALSIIILKNGTSTSIPVGIRLHPKEWDGNKVINRADSQSLNAAINKQKTDFDIAMALLSTKPEFASMTAAQVKKTILENKIETPANTKVSTLFEEYMHTNMSRGTREIYRATLGKVIKYGGRDLEIADVDYKWLLGFDKFLSETQGVNGKAMYLRDLRTICNYAKHIGVTDSYAFSNFQIKTEPTKKRSVSVDTFREFFSFKIPKCQERYRDYFLLMFYLIGINSVDLLHLRKNQLIDGRIEYIRAKTHKRYSIKVEPEAQYIIDKYSGKDFLLDAMDTCKYYKSFLHDMNDALKDIGPVTWEMKHQKEDKSDKPQLIRTVSPIIPNVSSYYARHTWATFAYEIGIPIDVISQALGHTISNRTTLIYVRYHQSKIDSANRQVIDYLGLHQDH